MIHFLTITAMCLIVPQNVSGYSPKMKIKGLTPALSVNKNSNEYTAVHIVPTGVGASIGGYAGDALPACRLLATACDRLITHPNVMNGAMLYAHIPNVLYVEGYALDEFAAGKLNLLPMTKKGHKIGLLLDASIEEDLRLRHLQVADAFRATLGIDVSACVVTSSPIGVEVMLTPSGASCGTLSNIPTLLEGAGELIKRGCTAIAVVVRFPEDESELEKELFEKYRQGEGVDAIAGAEAIISHVITQKYRIPCAHAPAFSPTEAEAEVDPKSCAEELGYTFLPCVLNYLHRAPSLVDVENVSGASAGAGEISAADVDAVVIPVNAMGGPAVLSLLDAGALIVAVGENKTVMDVSPPDLQNSYSKGQVVYARSYAEAAGLLLAHRHGILFEALSTHVPKIPITFL